MCAYMCVYDRVMFPLPATCYRPFTQTSISHRLFPSWFFVACFLLYSTPLPAISYTSITPSIFPPSFLLFPSFFLSFPSFFLPSLLPSFNLPLLFTPRFDSLLHSHHFSVPFLSSPTLKHTRTYPLFWAHIYPLSLTHTHAHTLSLSLSFALSLNPSHSLSHSLSLFLSITNRFYHHRHCCRVTMTTSGPS